MGVAAPHGKPSSLVDTRVIYCGDNLDQLRKLPDGCVDLIYIDPPFNSNRNYEVFWGDTQEKRAFDDTRDAHLEIKRAMREHNLEIIPITVQEILDEEVHIRV